MNRPMPADTANVNAVKINAAATLTSGISAPATSAPTAIDSRLAVALSAIALGAASRGTVSSTSAWRAGTSKTVAQPVANDSTTSAHTLTLSDCAAESQARPSAGGSASRRTPASKRVRLLRSASVPAARPNKRLGSMRAASTSPTVNAPPAVSSASHADAVTCAPVPRNVTRLDASSQQKLAERRARPTDTAGDMAERHSAFAASVGETVSLRVRSAGSSRPWSGR